MKNERYIDVRRFKKAHFKSRLWYRYELLCNRRDIKNLIKKIESGEVIDYKVQSNTKVLVLVEFLGKIVYLVYSLKHRTPITALPLKNYIRQFRILKEQINV
jgi:hypothetical protein